MSGAVQENMQDRLFTLIGKILSRCDGALVV